VKVEFEIDMAETVVVQVLNNTLKDLEGYVDRYEAGDTSFIAVFDTDPKKDLRKLKKLVKAIKKTRAWYAIPGEYDEE
jgi:hypothetical protein